MACKLGYFCAGPKSDKPGRLQVNLTKVWYTKCVNKWPPRHKQSTWLWMCQSQVYFVRVLTNSRN